MVSAQAHLAAWQQLRAPVVSLLDTLEAGGLEAGDSLGNGMVR